MPNHLHISALSFLIVALYIVMFGIMWRLISGWCADKPIGKAMAAIY